MRKIGLFFSLVILVLLLFPVIKSAYENVPTNDETFLKINANVFGIWRINYILITLKNIDDEKVKIKQQGWGYEIYNSEQRVYRTDYVFPLVWNYRTLYPGLPLIIAGEAWFGFDDFGKILPNGEYFVKGWVGTEFGILYSELVSFHLGKT